MTMPASISAGDLLLGVFTKDGTGGATGWPAGWIVFPTVADGTGTLAAICFYKYADGSETNFNVTTASEEGHARVWRITGHAGPDFPPLLQAWAGANANGPGPVLVREWATQDILSILACSWENTTPSGGVTGYTNLLNVGTGATNGMRVETRAISSFAEGATEDPVNYTTGSGRRAGFTILVPSSNADPSLTFPIVRNWMGSTATASSTSCPCLIPLQAQAGDILLISIGLVVNVTISSGLPSNWNTEVSVNGGGAGGERLYVLWKRYDPAVDVDFTLTLSGASASVTISCAVFNVDSTADVISGTATGGANANPDPPSLSADGDLWMAVCEHETRAVTAFPTSYDHRQAALTSGASVYLAFRQLAATSENPGTFTGNGSSFWAAATLAIGKANPRFFKAWWSE